MSSLYFYGAVFRWSVGANMISLTYKKITQAKVITERYFDNPAFTYALRHTYSVDLKLSLPQL